MTQTCSLIISEYTAEAISETLSRDCIGSSRPYLNTHRYIVSENALKDKNEPENNKVCSRSHKQLFPDRGSLKK